jgi:DNA-binding transcriptional LysR family regulator
MYLGLIGFDEDVSILKSFGGIAAQMTRENFAFRTDNVTAQLALLRAGAGIGACHTEVAAGDADLVPVLPKQVRFEREVWLVMHADLRKVRRVRSLYDHLRNELKKRLESR